MANINGYSGCHHCGKCKWCLLESEKDSEEREFYIQLLKSGKPMPHVNNVKVRIGSTLS